MKNPKLTLSPHHQIYRPQITSVLSIMHRITGFSLSFVIILLVLGLFALAAGKGYYDFYIKHITSYPLKLIIFPAILGITYHMLNGIRHMFWDLGFLISNKQASISGFIIIALSFFLSFLMLHIFGLI